MTNRGDTGRLHCFHQVKEKKRKEGEAARGQILWENFFLLPLLSPLSVLNDISLRFADSNFFADESWRQLAFPSNFIFAHKRLKNHTIRNVNVRIRIYAGRLQCYKEPNCISIYSKIEANKQGQGTCEHAKPNSRKGESKPGPACSEPD